MPSRPCLPRPPWRQPRHRGLAYILSDLRWCQEEPGRIFRFDTEEVYIRRDADTGDVVLSRRPGDWEEFFARADAAGIPDDFLAERNDPPAPLRPELDALFGDDKTP